MIRASWCFWAAAVVCAASTANAQPPISSEVVVDSAQVASDFPQPLPANVDNELRSQIDELERQSQLLQVQLNQLLAGYSVEPATPSDQRPDFVAALTDQLPRNEGQPATQEFSAVPDCRSATGHCHSDCSCADCLLSEQPQKCDNCPRVNNLNPAWSLKIGGTAQLDALFSTARPVAPGTPFFLAPKGPFEDDTFDIHARGTTLYFAGTGPKIWDYETGALVLFCLYNDSITADRYGILPLFAYGELKNESSRLAAGLQLDIFAPVIPTVLPFSILSASGNVGLYRGQLRLERFFYPADEQQITCTVGISDANPTIYNDDVLSEDNGLPDFEARAAWAIGPLQPAGLAAQRPFEIGVSGVVGQLRNTNVTPPRQVVADVWGAALDARWRVNEYWGLQGEVFVGQGLGTYGGSFLANTNTVTFEAIRDAGGWGEVYCYFTPCLHSHWGYGVDNPNNEDLAPGQGSFNSTIFANLIWDVTQSLRLGLELTQRDTEYVLLDENQGFGVQGQMQWKF